MQYSGLQKDSEQTDSINILYFLDSLEHLFYYYSRFILTRLSAKNIRIFD
jgi:hypothetical protein